MSNDPALDTFLAESAELLASMEDVLLRCEQSGTDPEAINELFRSAHTIKGSAGLFGLDPIVNFTHVVESVLDRARTGRGTVSAAAAAILLECVDHIGSLRESIVRDTDTEDAASLQAGKALLDRLTAETGFVPHESSIKPSPASAAQVGTAGEPSLDGNGSAAVHTWQVVVRFKQNVLQNGMDPLSFLRYLNSFGSIAEMHVVDDALPELEDFDAECCYLGFEFQFDTAVDKSRIEAAFEFVREDCVLQVTGPLAPATETASTPAATVPADGARLSEVARSSDVAESGTPARELRGADSRTIRVDGDKLDRLIDWIGELIIAGAATGSIARQAGLPVLQESALQLAHIVGEVRDQALKLRMVQIGSTFSRFQRVVRDVAREIGKDIRLEIAGADTELDRTLVEGIADPLTHLVRNAIDHGIETPELRRARGKSATGVVRLNAYHDAGSVVIEVADDGGGLKRDRILAKAVERGLVPAGDTLTDEQIYNLIFEPGFSTAEQVTNLSGRGVGMDVVKRNIIGLRGTVQMHSEEGCGTRVCIRLPLTLAIIDGFQVGVGRSNFVIPLDLVDECVEIDPDQGADGRVAAGHISLHGSVLPLIRLRDLFDIRQPRGRRQSVVVVRSGSIRVGIVVDELLGELQAVIKPLSKLFSRLQGIGGSTILGNGKVALILDIPGLVALRQSLRVPSSPATQHVQATAGAAQ